jgi:outer membrane lipoprotein SlyB
MTRHAHILCVCLLLTVTAAAQHKKQYVSPSPTIPAGTQLQVRVIDNLSSASAQPGQVFHGTLSEPIVVNGQTLYPKGADVTGRVVDAKSSGRLSAPGEMVLTLTSVSDGVHTTKLKTEPFNIKGQSHTKSNVTKIGGGAAAGAVIGAIVGGGKGAAIGAGVGAAAGTGVAAATGKKEATVESEAILSWNVTGSTPASTAASSTQAASAKTPMMEYNDTGASIPSAFSGNDVRSIKSCFVDHASELPPGLAKRESLPPGLQRQLDRNGTLPPGLQKKVQPLPEVCDSPLPRLPSGYRRVVYGSRVMLVDPGNKILDAFNLD